MNQSKPAFIADNISYPISQRINIWSRDNTRLMVLFFVSIIVVYFMPFQLNQMVFLVYLVLAYRSKKDYFWIAFFFILLDAPGRLFEGGSLLDVHRIPFYPIAAGTTINFEELFIFMYLLKALLLKRPFRFVFRRDFLFLIIYTGFVLTYSLSLGMSPNRMIATFRILLPWCFIYIVVKVMVREADFDKLNRLLFPFVFLALASQVYSYITGNYLGRILKGASFNVNILLLSAESQFAARAASSSIILLYCFTMGLYYLFLKKQSFPRLYLYLIVIVSFLSVYLSATRGWIVAFIFFFIMVAVTGEKGKNIKQFLSIGVLAIVVLTVFTYFFPLINIQMERTSERLYSMVLLAEGDITAGGTVRRLSERGPLVLKKVKESPFLGFGFSEAYFENADHHVGHHNILLNAGIIGYIILNFFFFKWCFQMFRFSRSNPVKWKYGHSVMKIICFAFLALYIVHSSSAQSWGWDITMVKILFYALLLNFFNILFKNSFIKIK